jgi:hypothetical protein
VNPNHCRHCPYSAICAAQGTFGQPVPALVAIALEICENIKGYDYSPGSYAYEKKRLMAVLPCHKNAYTMSEASYS